MQACAGSTRSFSKGLDQLLAARIFSRQQIWCKNSLGTGRYEYGTQVPHQKGNGAVTYGLGFRGPAPSPRLGNSKSEYRNPKHGRKGLNRGKCSKQAFPFWSPLVSKLHLGTSLFWQLDCLCRRLRACANDATPIEKHSFGGHGRSQVQLRNEEITQLEGSFAF